MIQKYTPTQDVEAFQFTRAMAKQWQQGEWDAPFGLRIIGPENKALPRTYIVIPSGKYASIGDWITRDAFGEFKVIPNKLFSQNFKPVQS